MDSKNKNQRIDIASWTAIILGILLGFLLKRVKFGFLFGLGLGILIVYLISRKKRRS